jgi:hypothetical protein
VLSAAVFEQANEPSWRRLKAQRTLPTHGEAILPSVEVDSYNEGDDGIPPRTVPARSSLMAFTWTETMQMLDPIGIDRWPYELSLKYGFSDALTCSVGRRWLVCYWSDQIFGKIRRNLFGSFCSRPPALPRCALSN